MGQNGGARPGAGAKKGARISRVQQLVEKARAEGIQPVEVLLHDMRFYFHLSENKMQQCMALEPGKQQANAFRAANALKVIARECAVAAAPYVHPKLAAIQANLNLQNHEERLMAFRETVAPAMSAFVNEVVENAE